jgi:endoglucanase
MNRRSLLKFAGLSAIATISDIAGAEDSAYADEAGSVACNQVGYLPIAEKIATVAIQADSDTGFEIRSLTSPDKSGRPVLRGMLSAPMQDSSSGQKVALADFSSFVEPGKYIVAAQGRQSGSFTIGKDVYREPLRLAMRSYYGQRCGCAVDLGNGYRHAACHLAGAFHKSSGRAGTLANHGGWHDAGDYGRYVVNSGITVGTLLWAWELYPQAVRKLSLQIPESGGKIPDYLAEIKWNLDWMLSMQDGDGGVWHKQTSEQFCAFVMPEQDRLTSYVIGTGSEPYKSTGATALLAAVAAIAARCYGEFDSAFATQCLSAAKRAFAWAVTHPNVSFSNPPGIGTGGYETRHSKDAILWAAAELWRTTGDAQFERAFLDGTNELPPEMSIRAPSWGSVAPMAYWSFLLSGRKGSSNSDAMKDRIREQTMKSAAALVARFSASGYGTTLAATEYVWGSNSTALNQSLLLLMANHLHPDKRTLEAALGNLHYVLGRNCFGVSWVTQVGTNPFEHPHHRPSASDGIQAPWPGLLSGGPNAHPGDKAARTLAPAAPMRMWMDDERAYSMNEVAINWNAPLVFVLAAANTL